MKLLILGGSGEAADLARALQGDARYDVTLSLAGRTSEPVALPGKLLTGGFGGAEGLARVLAEERFDLLVDATHPFAVQMKANAVEAGKIAGTKFLAIRRPPWVPREGDRWIMVESLEAAAARDRARIRGASFSPPAAWSSRLSEQRRNISILCAASRRPRPQDLPPLVELITARGPFNVADERALLEAHRIELIVTKNSGGAGAAAKLDAARALSLPVIMVERPDLPEAPSVETVADALAWLERAHGSTSSA